MLKLPSTFVERMKIQLGEEAERFFASYDAPRTQGLRLNPSKLTADDPAFLKMRELFRLEPVPWCPTGYYYSEQSVRPGKHPYHAAGLYYIQEPSAMSAVELLDPQPGETILDLAAAPGGKSTHILGKLNGNGLLIANEIHPARAKILSENIERAGAVNAVVTNASPDRLAGRFPLFFDRIMLDAPCSGEGMFRKDPEAIEEWSEDHVRMCAARQTDILRQAVRMLKPGGVLAYSTCTFNIEENEDTVEALLQAYPEFEMLHTERIWPHRQRGEGHFVAVLRKGSAAFVEETHQKRKREGAGRPTKHQSEAMQRFEAFRSEALPGFALGPGEPLLFGEQLYWLPHTQSAGFTANDLQGLKVLRPGLHLGELKKNRFEPSHALALAIREDQARQTFRLSSDSPQTEAYLKGEALPAGLQYQGWIPVTVDGYPLGWGKSSGSQIKNHYPKGLRWLS
jgi:16S rRNA C967 or C1407 C5-methylase (RsmB/RsmF family)/NOL1/NOP2/fmu family ribosome biogenesis protein